MAEGMTCPACGQRFGTQREADDHKQKMHGEGGKKAGDEAPRGDRPISQKKHGE